MKAVIAGIMLLCAMPAIAESYSPGLKLSGTIRVSGNDQMAALLKRWERGFRKFHPDVRFEEWLKGSGSALYGLEVRTADIALAGRAIKPYQHYRISQRASPYPGGLQ